MRAESTRTTTAYHISHVRVFPVLCASLHEDKPGLLNG